jgi:hypothetical protein
MRLTSIAVFLCLGATLLAGRAEADAPMTPLIEGDFSFLSSNDPDHTSCQLFVAGQGFVADGSVTSVDDAHASVGVSFNTVEPTSITRTSDKLAINQSKFAALSMAFSGSGSPLVHAPIEKCSVTRALSASKSKASVSLRCKGDDLSDLLSADQIASLKQALANLPDVKFKVNSLGTVWSLSITCAGALPHG